MSEPDRERILELRKVVRWLADLNAFALLHDMEEARWAIAEAQRILSAVVGMVGAVPLGEIGILCYLAVHHDYRKMGLGVRLSPWAVSYLRSRSAETVRLVATYQAEVLYRALGFELTSRRVTYRLEGTTLKARVRDARSQSPRSSEGALSITPLVFGDLPELYGVDRWSFGADRSALILATLRLHPSWGLVARDASGRIKGYLIRSASKTGTRIGPFGRGAHRRPRPTLPCGDGERGHFCRGHGSRRRPGPCFTRGVQFCRSAVPSPHRAGRDISHEGSTSLRHHSVSGYLAV